MKKILIILFFFIHRSLFAQMPYNLAPFSNIELIGFCMPLPKEYRLLPQEIKASFEFENKNNKNLFIKVTAFSFYDIYGKSLTLEAYYKKSYPDNEEEMATEFPGKIIEKKEILKEKNYFFAQGYYSNLIYESKFIEINWLINENEVVRAEIFYPVADIDLWEKRLNYIIKNFKARVCD